MRFLTTLLVGIFSVTATAAPLTYAEKMSELEALAALIKSQYGPLEYKDKLLKVSPEALVAQYEPLVKTSTNTEFYYLINRFVAEFRDSHFGSKLQSTYVTTLGFIADRIENKIVFDEIDRTLLPADAFPFVKGDEIISVGGTPVNDVIAQLGAHIGSGFIDTNRRSSAMLVGFRPASTVPPQTGGVSIEWKSLKTGNLNTTALVWHAIGEPLEEGARAMRRPVAKRDFADLSVNDYFNDLPKTEKSIRCSGKTRVRIPDGAVKLLEDPFVAYIHETPKGKVGYLRIPHYAWKNAATGEDENGLRLRQYEWVIEQMEKSTVGLVIDQDHNCGGNVAHLERMVSLFAEKPFLGVQFQFLSTRNEYLQFKQWLGEVDKTTVEGNDFLEVLDLVKQHWLKGDRLTPKTTFQSSRLIYPNPIHYTKPVVMLIDEMSGSGGDAFPAMLQGLGRAKLLGNRTMGAGGHVVEVPPLNYSGNTLRITKSLFYHPNGVAIENNGVTPDVAYAPTTDDFLNGYTSYQKFYLAELAKLIK